MAEFFELYSTQLVGHLGAPVSAVHFDPIEDLLWIGDEAVRFVLLLFNFSAGFFFFLSLSRAHTDTHAQQCRHAGLPDGVLGPRVAPA